MTTQLYQTRRRLITAIKKKGAMAVGDLADELGITGMAVRKHLAGLERDGLVTATLEHRDTGRPRYVYSLTQLAHDLFPQSYHHIALNVLDDIAELYGPAEVSRVLGRRSDRMEERYRAVVEDKDVTGKVAELSRLRDEDGFLADWEQEGDGFVLREHHCPLFQVASEHPVACSLELQMFRNLMPEAEIFRSHCQVDGQHVCTYHIRPRQVAADGQAAGGGETAGGGQTAGSGRARSEKPDTRR